MKIKILTTTLLAVATMIACKAQQPVVKISADEVKVNSVKYRLNRPNNNVTKIVNTNNKLTNVKAVAPNLPSDVKIPQYVKYDKNVLLSVCADVIPLATLEKLPKGIGDWIFVTFKVNPQGKVMEMEFLLKNTSLITASEIQKIEEKIKNSSFTVSFTYGIERYFEGANYFFVYTQLAYKDIYTKKIAK